MGSAREPIVLSDSEDEGFARRRVSTHSSYVRQTTTLDNHYLYPPTQQDRPSQKLFNFAKSQTLGFSHFPRAFSAPKNGTRITSSPSTQVNLGTPKVPPDHPRSSSRHLIQQKPTTLSNDEITMTSLNRLSNGLSSAVPKNDITSTRLFTPNFAQTATFPSPQAQARPRKDVASNENDNVPNQETRNVSDISNRKICRRCVRTGTTCDGLQPCTPCQRTLHECFYQPNVLTREKRPSLIVKLPMPRRSSFSCSTEEPESPELVSRSARGFDANSRPSHYTVSAQKHVDGAGVDDPFEPRNSQQKPKPSYDAVTAEPDHDNTSSDESSPPLVLDLSIDAVRKLVDDMQKDQYSWQEKSVQAELRQATFDMKTRRLPALDLNMPDPFRVAFEKEGPKPRSTPLV